MPINPVGLWASSYESTWKDVFAAAQGKGFDGTKATQDAWAKWNDSNANKLQCIPPLTPPTPLSGKTTEKAFAPLVFPNPGKPPDAARIIATAWQAWASAITWVPCPPGPPFSSVVSVITDPASVSNAYSSLMSGLIAEFAKVPANDAAVPAKYQAIGQLFQTAAISLQVKFIGFGIGSPPPPLAVSVPVF